MDNNPKIIGKMKLLYKIYCLIGLHSWTPTVNYGVANMPFSQCKRCGKVKFK